MATSFRIKDLFSNYLRHDEVNDYLDYLALNYPKLVTVSKCGESYEGRTVKCIKISHNNVNDDETFQCNRTVKSAKFKSTNGKSTGKCRRKSGFAKSAHTKMKSKTDEMKSIVLIDGGIHGREWISVATTVYCINQLIENFRRNTQLLKKLEFLIVPIVNVDGYEYSHTNVSLDVIAFFKKTKYFVFDICESLVSAVA